MADAKSVLLLGSGMCSPPLISYLLKHGFRLTVATRTVSKAEGLLKGHPNGKGVAFDITQDGATEKLDALVQEVDLVISLLPYIYHVESAKIALKHKKHFCTASYISDAMLELEPIAKEAGVIMINECGVDPGLDHMSAQKVIDEVHAKGGKVREFYSICGGLPAPDANDNPLGYKLAWSPRGVLLASRNNALFLENGESKDYPGIDLYSEGIYRSDFVESVGDLEWYANRDSVKYIDIYKIPEVQTIIRGTYRYPGWCRMMRKVAMFGFTSLDEIEIQGITYAAFTAKVLGLESTDDLRSNVAKKLELEVGDDILNRLEWLGLFDAERTVKEGIKTALDAMCFLFEEKMQYAEGEKDMICMKHTFDVEYADAGRERLTSTLIDFGMQPEGDTSMARTVALPLAIAVRAVLEGRTKLTGIVRPVIPELYNLILDEMEKENVKFTEETLPTHIQLRNETKEMEYRTAITPEGVKTLIAAGYRVSVERSPARCFPDEEYAAAGAKLVETNSWVNSPPSTLVVGLKELPEDAPLRQRHVYFGHCFKGQDGAKDLLGRFQKDNGLLYDIEFLVQENGRRIAAFGYPAGYSGAALGVLHWAEKQDGKKLSGPLSPWMSNEALQDEVRAKLNGRTPVVHVMGALGRAGRGACDFVESVGGKVVRWDLEETKGGGPFPQILESHVLVNCIYLSEKLPPFLTAELLASKEKNLSVVVDVSCDPNNPNNPLPFYSEITTPVEPVLSLADVDVIAIDHLPSLLPQNSSVMFSKDFVPYLASFKDKENPNSKVFDRSLSRFHSALKELS